VQEIEPLESDLTVRIANHILLDAIAEGGSVLFENTENEI